jgi:hypothetical protein
MGGDGEREIVSEFDLGEKDVESVAGLHPKAGKDPFPPDATELSRVLKKAQRVKLNLSTHMLEIGPIDEAAQDASNLHPGRKGGRRVNRPRPDSESCNFGIMARTRPRFQ